MRVTKIILVSLFLAAMSLSANHVEATTTARYEKLFYYTKTQSAKTSLAKNIGKIDIVAPQVYSINKNLIPYGQLDEDLRNLLKDQPIKIMPLVTNDGFRQDIIHNLLASTTAQEKIIDFMVREAKSNGYYGWQLDLEHIPSYDRDLFSLFVERTYKNFKKNNLALSIAVVARSGEPGLTDWYKNWSGAFDYNKLSQNSDFISLMTYDDPDSTGPSASIPFVIRSLEYVLKSGVLPQKISLGIPTYYWSWTTNPPKRLRSGSYGRLLSIKTRNNCQESFSNTLGVPWMAFREDGVDYKVWYENQKSFNLKTELVNKYRLRGFSVWTLGTEDPSIWNNL